MFEVVLILVALAIAWKLFKAIFRFVVAVLVVGLAATLLAKVAYASTGPFDHFKQSLWDMSPLGMVAFGLLLVVCFLGLLGVVLSDYYRMNGER